MMKITQRNTQSHHHQTIHYLVDSGESSALFRHLCHDIRRAKDRLQIEPCSLYLQPLIQNILYEYKLRLPVPVCKEKNIIAKYYPLISALWYYKVWTKRKLK